MFFLFSKLLAIFLKPLNIILFIGIAALFTREKQRKMRRFCWMLLVLVLFSNQWIINALAKKWETARYSPEDLEYPYDIGILLGGYSKVNRNTPKGQVSFFLSDRLTTTLQLYKMGKIKRILLSGGAGKLVGRERSEAPLVRDYLLKIGIPDSAILVEDRSRNTRENALFSKEIIDRVLPGARCLIITSAWHMRRAQPCFERVGIACAPFGTDFLSENSDGNPFKWLEPSWSALLKWELLLKEWVGYVVYQIHY